jgi:hypothetical protein
MFFVFLGVLDDKTRSSSGIGYFLDQIYDLEIV